MKSFWCEIVCCGCSKTTAGRFVFKQVPVRQMTKEAEARGWRFHKVNRPDLPGVSDWECKSCFTRKIKS